MRPYTPTASGLQRALACPASCALPRGPYTSSPQAEHGTGVHAFLAQAVTEGREKALAAVPPDAPWRPACEAIDTAALLACGESLVGVELTYAYDLATDAARFLGENLTRRYGELAPTEIAGTADLVTIDDGGCVWVSDYKTGQSVGPVAENAQLRFLALCASRYYPGNTEIGVALVYLREDGSTRIEKAVLDALDLDIFAEELRAGLEAIRQAQADHREGRAPATRPGDHCRYCPAFDACPEQRALARSLASGLGLTPEAVANLTPGAAGAAWERLQQVKALADVVEGQLRDLARIRPFHLSDGRLLTYVEGEREELVERVAVEVLERLYGPVVAASCVERKVTKASLRRGLGESGDPKEALREIEAAGGLKRVPYAQLRPLKKGR
jgi:hypothetical protein